MGMKEHMMGLKAKGHFKGHKQKSARQVRFLFSSGSPLSQAQKDKLASEIRTKKVKIKGK